MQFDLFKHEYTNFFVQHKFKINSIVHVPNTVNFLSSDCGGNIFKWDIRTKEPVGTINLKNEKDFPKDGKAGHVNTLLAADPTGQIVAVVSQKALFMFDLNKMGSSSFSSKGDMYSFTTDMKDLKFSQSGNLITTVDQHGHVYTVDSFELKNSKDDFEIPSVCAPLINDKLPNNMDELMPIYEGQDISADCDYFMDERYLVYGGNCGLLYLRDINEKKSITALHPGPQKRTKINKIKYGNSNLILTAGEDLSLWEANEQQPL
uniref:WD_REPEATS_REGION domain-containing protein n=1 Tax=Rhabditophanes sp. KR3021 TaxID=114890 RepID=A0AC35TN93_9BILA